MIHLVTDTTAYLPPRAAGRWPIHTVPLKVTMGARSVDEDQVPLEEFYQRLAQVATAPTTSQPAPGDFLHLYERLLQNGDEIISVHISGELSGTVRVAQLAAQELATDRITVVDSRVTTCLLTTVIASVARALEAGATRQEVAALVGKMAQHSASAFLVEDLEYLRKGGRINGAAKFLGTMLNVRPLLHLDKGKIEPLTMTRTRKRGKRQLIQEIKKRVGKRPVHAAVTHIQCAAEAEELGQRVQQELNCETFFINETGPVIGSHVGPGFIGASAYPADLG